MRILDMGSGNTSKNDINIIKKMIDALAEVDPERKFIIKYQLFKDAPPNIPLEQGKFSFAHGYATGKGYKTTASVFDIESLNFLLQFDPCFVKIANRPDLYWLIGEVPRKIPIIIRTIENNNCKSNAVGMMLAVACFQGQILRREPMRKPMRMETVRSWW